MDKVFKALNFATLIMSAIAQAEALKQPGTDKKKWVENELKTTILLSGVVVKPDKQAEFNKQFSKMVDATVGVFNASVWADGK